MRRSFAPHNFTPALAEARTRCASILAWGSNKKGQCGSSAEALVLRPTETLPLDSCPCSVYAGRLHSATVLSNGDVWTWGSGEAGKLGLGSTQDTYTPTRVEAFVGRTHMRDLALGHQHTLFLDKSGLIFACGENKEGQCGLGTSLETIAGQRRLAWAAGLVPQKAPARHQSIHEAGGRSGRRPADAGQAGPSVSTAWQVAQDEGQISSPFAMQQQRMEELRHAQRLWERAGPAPGTRASESSLEGLMPGQLHTPARLGRDLHNPLASSTGASPETPAAAVKLAASRFFSALIDENRQVFSFGGDYNGALGNAAAWSPAAKRVDGEVQQALEENGGAVDIAAGSTFCLANTSSGKVVMWGGWPGARTPRSCPAHHYRGVAVAELMNLPAIQHVAAGHSHALFSDGERVWALGQWLSADGSNKTGPGWASGPQQVLGPVAGGITALSAGAHCCAALSASGHVYMWGSLVSKDQAEYLSDTTSTQPLLSAVQQEWSWVGMGSDAPSLVPGLDGVKGIALGSMHAMALVR